MMMPLSRNLWAAWARKAVRAPVWLMISKAPPMISTMNTTLPAACMPELTDSNIPMMPTGFWSIYWKVPALTIWRPVLGSATRSNCPAGTIQVRITESRMRAQRMTMEWGNSRCRLTNGLFGSFFIPVTSLQSHNAARRAANSWVRSGMELTRTRSSTVWMSCI